MPYHSNRIWCLDQNEDGSLKERTVDEVMAFFTDYSAMVLCTAFYVNGHLWVNDSFNEDGFQEYAVIQVDAEQTRPGFITGIEIESITINWGLEKGDLREFMEAPVPFLNRPIRLALGHGKRCTLRVEP